MRSARLTACAVSLTLTAFFASAGEPPEAGKSKSNARRETTPPTLSLYLPIALDVSSVDDPATGVFLPEKFRVESNVDVVLFLRGYDVKRPKSATGVAEYWNSPSHPVLKSFLLREEVNRSGRNAILVAPPLGPFSQSGRLSDANGLRMFLDRVMDGLWRNGPHSRLPEPPRIRNLILAAHSGGGVPLRRLAEILGSDSEFKDKLKACWGFDSIYGVRDKDADFWAAWASDHPTTQFAMF